MAEEPKWFRTFLLSASQGGSTDRLSWLSSSYDEMPELISTLVGFVITPELLESNARESKSSQESEI